MTAPANDNRADAELVPDPDTLYWGIVTGGTTVDATDEDAGPLHDVWYTWEDDLPEGNVYLYVEPHAGAPTDLQYTARLYSATPADADGSVPFAQASGFIGDPTATLRLHHWHIGGPLTLQVFTNTEDDVVGDIDFDFGWGHDLDADASHWGATTQDDWANTLTDGIFAAASQVDCTPRRGHGSTFVEVSGTSVPPPGDIDCAWANARDGVDQPVSVDVGDPDNCDYTGPAGGTFDQGVPPIQHVGAVWDGLAAGGFLPSPPNPPLTPGTDRLDYFSTSQFMWAWRWGDAHHGTITIDDTAAGTPATERQVAPVTFAAYQASANPKRAWGYDYTQPMTWATRDFRLTGAPSFVTNAASADHLESPSVVARFVTSAVSNLSDPDDAAFDNPSLTPNAVYLHEDVTPHVEASYVTNDVAGAGDTLASFANDASTPVDVVLSADEAGLEALMIESAADLDGPRWLVAVVVDDLVVSDTPPTVYTPNRGISLAPGDPDITDRSQQFTGNAPLLNWDYRLPQWRPYKGFPLTAPTTGWRIGRIGAGNSPW